MDATTIKTNGAVVRVEVLARGAKMLTVLVPHFWEGRIYTDRVRVRASSEVEGNAGNALAFAAYLKLRAAGMGAVLVAGAKVAA